MTQALVHRSRLLELRGQGRPVDQGPGRPARPDREVRRGPGPDGEGRRGPSRPQGRRGAEVLPGLRAGEVRPDRRGLSPYQEHPEGHGLPWRRQGQARADPRFSEADRIKGQVAEGIERPKPSIQLRDRRAVVRVADGPFASFNGTVEEIDEGSCPPQGRGLDLRPRDTRRAGILARSRSNRSRQDRDRFREWQRYSAGYRRCCVARGSPVRKDEAGTITPVALLGKRAD